MEKFIILFIYLFAAYFAVKCLFAVSTGFAVCVIIAAIVTLLNVAGRKLGYV